MTVKASKSPKHTSSSTRRSSPLPVHRSSLSVSPSSRSINADEEEKQHVRRRGGRRKEKHTKRSVSEGNLTDNQQLSKEVEVGSKLPPSFSSSSSSSCSRSHSQKQQYTSDKKGVWFPAALFIFLSHCLCTGYFISLAYVHWISTAPLSSYFLFQVSSKLLWLTALTTWLHLLGITAGYHRLWSHRAYAANTGLRIFLAIIGLMSFQGSARWWALKHRLHHRFTDTASDPYDSTRGLWYTHIAWLFEAPPYIEKVKLISMRDLDADWVVCFQKKYLLHGYALFGLLLPGLIGIFTDDSFILGALWLGFIARLFSWHAIWTINSISHWQGYKEFSNASTAVYVAIINLVQNGEGHHNYHHAFPTDYRHGHRWYEWDPTKWCINLWWYLGWATELVTMDSNQVMQSQAQTLQENADIVRAKARWPTPVSQLPRLSIAEFDSVCLKGLTENKIFVRLGHHVLDVTSFNDHPGGKAYLRAFAGKNIQQAFHGGVNLHTQAANNHALMYRVAVIQ